MTYATTQAQAKDRVIMKRRLRVLGFIFRNELPTIDLALMLRNADPSFVFPVNIAINLRDYDRDNNPQYTAKQIQFEGSPLSFLLNGGQLNQQTIESIQSLADNLAWFLNDGLDKDATIAQVFSKSSHNTPAVKELVLKTVLG
jgi:hypothetical protein